MSTQRAARSIFSSPDEPLLKLCDTYIGFGTSTLSEATVRRASLEIRPGSVAALVGESGSGKTLLAKSLLGLLPQGARVLSGSAHLLGRDIFRLDATEQRALRGAEVGLILQEPLTALNPALKIGRQMTEALVMHSGSSNDAARSEAMRMLDRVGIDRPTTRMGQYPHEFSGGMRQRIMIAAMLMLKPRLLIADEPTTAIDAQAQREVMALMLGLVREIEAAMLLITHDLGVVVDYADSVFVMERGELVESGQVADCLVRPQHEYTRRLLSALPGERAVESASPVSDKGDPCLQLKEVSVVYPGSRAWPWSRRDSFPALSPTSLTLHRGEVLSLVGESGSGKTTLARSVVGLAPLSKGEILFDGAPMLHSGMGRRRLASAIQMVFQDPYSSLDPRWRVGDIVAEPLRGSGLSQAQIKQVVLDSLAACGLQADYVERFPHALSGGQRQRVGIARALVVEPELVVADEPVSALDLTVQAQILALIQKLQEDRGFSLLFISHDLSVVEQISDRVAVMRNGRIVERGRTKDIFKHATHPYTKALLRASPVLGIDTDGAYRLGPRQPQARSVPQGWRCAELARDKFDGGLKEIDLGDGHQVLVEEA
ncbi:MAG: ABC transporter ATP-binding protein [Pseudomonadota bacterium]